VSNDFDKLEAPSVQAQVEPSTARLGDLITLSIRVTHPEALVVDPPAFAKTLGTFEVYASTRLPVERAAGKTIDPFRAALQNFTTGQQVLPGLEVPYRDPMGQRLALKTPPLTVTIQEVPPGPKDKGDIRGMIGVLGPTAWSPWGWVLVASLISALCILLWRKRKRALQGPPPPPPIPADERALEKLRKLAASDYLATGKLKEYYIAISDIVREYIEGVFQVMALERTTNEIMRDLRKNAQMATEQQLQLRELLDNCDLVKFAKFRPDAAEAGQAHACAVRFVEETWDALWDTDEPPPPSWGRTKVGGKPSGTPHPSLPPQGGKGIS
jgi:hypothetical protein